MIPSAITITITRKNPTGKAPSLALSACSINSNSVRDLSFKLADSIASTTTETKGLAFGPNYRGSFDHT